MSSLTLTIEAHVAHVHLHRPPGNRLSLDLIDELNDTFSRIAQDRSVRVAWLSGEGEDFCQGADLNDERLREAMTFGREGRESVARRGERLMHAWSALPVPTIVSAKGHIVGGGAGLFLAADLRVASPDAELLLPEVNRAMHLAWGIIPVAVRELGPSRARWLALTGESLKVSEMPGLAKFVGDPDQVAAALATSMAAKAPLAVRALDGTLRDAERGHYDSDREAFLFAETTGSEDFGEAVAAFLERRPPVFRGV